MTSQMGQLSILASLCLPLAGWSQQPTSPSAGAEIPTLQEAIYSASPGAVLRADRYGPPGQKGHIIVDRPLTLVGGTYLSIAISGAGRVFLRDVQVQAGMIGTMYSGDQPYPAIEVSGSGLLVAIVNSRVVATGEPTMLRNNGAPAVRVHPTFPDADATLLLINSSFHASIGGSYGGFTCGAPDSGYPAVEAWDSVVYAWNSEFYGGGGFLYWWDDSSCPQGPHEPPAAGAPGLIADHLWYRDCTFVGGPGARWDTWPSVGASGPPFHARWNKELGMFGSKAKPR